VPSNHVIFYNYYILALDALIIAPVFQKCQVKRIYGFSHSA